MRYSFPECLEPATRVVSRWKNGNYYKGEIDSITNRVNVLFDNGARLAYNPRDNVDIVVDRIPDHNELPWGSQILVNRPRSRAFNIGYIRDIKNGRFVVLYENGDQILHTLDQIRSFNKSRICGKLKKIMISSTITVHSEQFYWTAPNIVDILVVVLIFANIKLLD